MSVLRSHTFVASIEAIVPVSVVPVMVNIEPDTMTVDPSPIAVRILNPIQVEDHDALHGDLESHGIGTGIHYKIPGHRQPALADHPHRASDLSATEEACRELISIPMYPELSDKQIDYVAQHVRSFVADRATTRSGA